MIESTQKDKNVIVVLNSFEEEKVLRRLKANALSHCGSFLREFSECVTGKGISMTYKCAEKNRLMQQCVSNYTGEEQRDIYREEELLEKQKRYFEIKT